VADMGVFHGKSAVTQIMIFGTMFPKRRARSDEHV